MSIFTPTARRRRIGRLVAYALLALLIPVGIGLRVSESMRNHDGLWAAVVAVALVAGYVTYGIWSRCEHCQGFLPDGWTRARSCRHCGGRLG